MDATPGTASLHKWDIRQGADVAWMPWGNQGNAKAKILGT